MHILKKTLKIALWSIFAIALLFIGVIIGMVNFISPQQLTSIAESSANKALNANVSIGNAELSLRKSWPFLNLDVDDLVIVSRDIAELPAAARDTLPQWADTLLSVGKLHGGINVCRMAIGQIGLNDLKIVRPQANVLIVNSSLNNFSIVKKQEEKNDTSAMSIPDIRIKSFKFIDPQLIRYADMTTGTLLAAKIETVSLVNEGEPKGFVPCYRIDFLTDVSSPLLSDIGITNVPIGLDGTIEWLHDFPFMVKIKDLDFLVSLLSGKVNTEIDLSDNLTVNSFNLKVNPFSIEGLLNLVNDSIKDQWNLPKGVNSNANISIEASLTKPYVAGTDSLPTLRAKIDIPECYFKWGKVDVENFCLDVTANIDGNDLDASTVDIECLKVCGPATSISAKANLASLISDPAFDVHIDGRVLTDKLPPELLQLIGNASLSGTLEINADIKAQRSMLSRDNFHKIQAKGSIDASQLYYLADDTLTMFYIHSTKGTFGSNETAKVTRRQSEKLIDSLLMAKIDIDSAKILVSGLNIGVKSLNLGVGAQNTAKSTDTTAIIPMGGHLHIGDFSLFTLSDSAGVRVRKLDGALSMQRYKGDSHLPLFRLQSSIGSISAGDNATRFVVRDSKLNVRLNKLSDDQLPKTRREMKRLADSISKMHPEIPVDSVYKLALQIRRRHSTGKHRVHLVAENQENEVIEWGASRGFKRFLLDWNLKGSLTAGGARLFTTAFPLRNKVNNLGIKFNNDSIILTNVEWKTGHSDFLISGNVSNMKKAFTSRQHSPVKINFEMLSDTIDVNEIAATFFRGAAAHKTDISNMSEEEMEAHLEKEAKSDSISAILIPINIDARFQMKANHVLYSDMAMTNLGGTVMAYDGALNLHNLHATSDVGSLQLSALYSAPSKRDMKFGFGLDLNDFNIKEFLKLVPAIDSIMPMLRNFGGIINAQIAATSDVDNQMNLVLPTLSAVVNLRGDSLVLMDEKTYKTVAKWLFFKDKSQCNNMIKNMSVNIVVEDNMLQLYPFIFDFDRYKLGISGHNDLQMNFDYHVAVLKSPIPFKFGINVKGNPDKYKIRLGRARFNEKASYSSVTIADTTRINLINQFENVFRRGVRNSDFAHLKISKTPTAADIDLDADTISRADSLYLINNGLMPTD